jgi:hypothetical protein
MGSQGTSETTDQDLAAISLQKVKTMNAGQRKKCCAVAQDVLDHMRYVKVTEGTYCEGELPKGVKSSDESAKKHIDGISKGCRVCALGACFLSYIRLYNNVTLSELVGTFSNTVTEGEVFESDYHEISNELDHIFSQAQLCLIETAFELHCINDDYDCDDADGYTVEAEADAAVAFGRKYDDPKVRLKAIMKNIIKNNGEFIPDKKLHALAAENMKQMKKHKQIPTEIV